MDINGVYSSYNAGTTNSTSSSGNSGANLTIDDFFQLLAAQLQNQNMMDPVDNTQFIAQMAQFSTLSQMNELAGRVNTSFAVSLVGKTVTVMGEDEAGNAQQQTGVIEEVTFQNKVPYLLVNGKIYGLEDITTIKEAPKEEETQAVTETAAAGQGEAT